MDKKNIFKIIVAVLFILMFLASIYLLRTNDNPNGDEEVESIVIETEGRVEVEDEITEVFISEGWRTPFDNISQLSEFATHIVRGEILASRVERMNFFHSEDPDEEIVEMYEVVTVYQLQILEEFQISHSVEYVIEVISSGGEYDNERWILEDGLNLEVGQQYILFLFSNEDIGFPFAFADPIQGAYHIPDFLVRYENLFDYENLHLELESVSERDRIPFTIEDLIEIARYNGLLD